MEWVSVTDKDNLPDYFTAVNVYCPKAKNIYCAYRNAREEWYTFDPSVAGIKIEEEVSHWAPMIKRPDDATYCDYKVMYDSMYTRIKVALGEERYNAAMSEVLNSGNQGMVTMLVTAIEKLRDDAGDFD